MSEQNAYFKSKKTPLILLGITALVCSRTLFAFFNDPEGPNLLVVVVMAAIIYSVSLVAYLFNSSAASLKRLWLAIAAQILLVVGLYFLLR